MFSHSLTFPAPIRTALCSPTITKNLCTSQMHSNPSPLEAQDEAEEIRIPVPWGHVAGKWWGPKDVRPVLCLHGWQDNAGSFDTLIPLLPKHLSYLAIDIPGHGFSSRYPDGMNYQPIDYLNVLNIIKKEYSWDKISLMAHSMGSIVCFNYCGIFPDKVDFMIGIDALKSHIRDKEKVAPVLEYCYTNLLVADERNRNQTEPPSYSYDETVKKLNEATRGSVTLDSGHYILRRNLRKSTKYPEKYYFARDNRLKYSGFLHLPQEVSLEFARRQKMPYLFLKAKNSPYYEDKKYFEEAIEFMTKHNPKFEWHMIDATHHMHLTAPHTISDLISKFICKARPSSDGEVTEAKSKL